MEAIRSEKLKGLVSACQQLGYARSMAEVMAVVRHAARVLTGSDGATFVLLERTGAGDLCYYADEEAIAPLWKGVRFPMDSCVSGWSIRNKSTAVIPDIFNDERVPHELYTPTFVRSLVMSPIRRNEPIGAIGTYWKEAREPDADEVMILDALADITALSIDNVRLFNYMDHRVEERTEELDRANREVLANIQYAKRIQEAMLPKAEDMARLFPEHFTIYQPKSIVSGDFYWLAENQGMALIAAADCTGHGVTGALLSAMCSQQLDRAVSEFGLVHPGMILDMTREFVWERLAGGTEMADGMDISLCAIDLRTKVVRWSGANTDLWYVSKGQLQVVKAHREAVGRTRNSSKFPTHRLQLEKGDTIYLMTDGFADQFGGPRGKKYGSRPMKQLLQGLHLVSMAEQDALLRMAFEEWKGDLEQVDDVTLIGIRL
ncbi:MAG TPA: SpoIIE family protein phosphatase [Flavobacteriales bacterium]|nr:SpoIIE family protein phosphatase [Flavobacteriales bacterium]